MALLGWADERYDLYLASGQILARGIFSGFKDPVLLGNLLEATMKWHGKSVYLSGDRLTQGAVETLIQILACYAGHRLCRQGSYLERRRYLGCHLAGVGLLGCSLALIKDGHRFWFHFFDKDPRRARIYRLNRQRLLLSQQSARLCPAFPDDVETIVSHLNVMIDLEDDYQARFWKAAPNNSIGMTIMPRMIKNYERWMRKRLEARH